MNKPFVTHTGEEVSGKRLQDAFSKVADFYTSNARAVRLEDAYADHVTEQTKDSILVGRLELAERIRRVTEPMAFWLWQRVDTELTGKCVALLEGR